MPKGKKWRITKRTYLVIAPTTLECDICYERIRKGSPYVYSYWSMERYCIACILGKKLNKLGEMSDDFLAVPSKAIDEIRAKGFKVGQMILG